MDPTLPKSERSNSQSDNDNASLQDKLTASIVFNVVLAIVIVTVVIALLFVYNKYRVIYKLNQYHTKKDTIQMENSITVNSV